VTEGPVGLKGISKEMVFKNDLEKGISGWSDKGFVTESEVVHLGTQIDQTLFTELEGITEEPK
jgi:hypothetical protein